MQRARNANAGFIGDDFASPSKGGRLLCNPTGGPRVVVVRNEDNIKKGVYRGSSVVGASITKTGSGRPLAREEGEQNMLRSLLLTTNNNNNNNNTYQASSSSQQQQQLPPKSPNGTFKKTQSDKMREMSLPQLLQHAAHRRRPNATPSEISLVTSVESREASTNHPCSETVYSCTCCRPKKPSSVVAGSSVIYSNQGYNEDDDDSLYDNLTSVSQRGEIKKPIVTYGVPALVPKNKQDFPVRQYEQQISAKQIFELQQARAGAAGSKGHNEAGAIAAIGTSGRRPMGFALQSQKFLDVATNRGLSARTAPSEVSSLTHTSVTNNKEKDGEKVEDQQQKASGSVVSQGRRSQVSRASSSKVSSSALRKLEEALEQERQDRLKTEEQISRIRERQEKLMSQLTPEERIKMQKLMEKIPDDV
jgi:hypothetical protein